MSKFTVNNKEFTHKELNLMWDFFTEDQWDLIVTSLRNIEDDDADSPYNEGINPTIESIQQLWRSAY